MERSGMSVVQSLRQNDPTLSFIRIDLQQRHWEWPDDDDALAQALEQNNFVTEIFFVNIPSSLILPRFLRVIATREQLDTVRLGRYVGEGADFGGLLAFVRAIQQNPNIRSVGFASEMPRQILTSFVDDDLGTNLKALELTAVTGNSVRAAFDNAYEVGWALWKNENIESLESLTLRVNSDDVFVRNILGSLQFTLENSYLNPYLNPSLTHLTLSNHFIVTEWLGLRVQGVLEATTSIRCFVLTDSSCLLNNEGFPAICRGLLNSRAVSDIKFVRCTFVSGAMDNDFSSMLQRKANLRSLSMVNCIYRSRIQEMLKAFFLREDSPVRYFKLEAGLDDFFINGSVQSFLAAVAESKLESFSFGRISSQQQLESLANIIPAMKVKELEVSVRPDLNSFNTFFRAVAKSKLERFLIGNVSSQEQLESLMNNIPAMTLTDLEVAVRPNLNSRITRQALLEAVGNNFCLRSVMGTVRELDYVHGSWPDLFADAEDKQRLEFYMDRNQRLEEWVKNPAPVREDVWPEALQLADRAGPNTLYQSMLALSEFGIGLTAGQRERSTEPSP